MADDCVISEKSLSLTCLNSGIFVWWCHSLLIWLASEMRASPQIPVGFLTFLSQLPLLMTPLSFHPVCAKYIPVLLRTTKLAQSASQDYFVVLQSLRKVLHSTTLYYKASTKHFPVLLRTTKLAQSISHYYFASYYREAFTHRSLCTRKLYTQKSFHTPKLWDKESVSHRSFHTNNLLHRTFLHTAKVYTQQPCTHSQLLHRKAFAHRSFYTQKAFTHKSLYTQKLLQIRHAFTQKSLLHRTCGSKTGPRRQSKKNDDFEAVLKKDFSKESSEKSTCRFLASLTENNGWKAQVRRWASPSISQASDECLC